MAASEKPDVTRLLQAVRDGETDARARLFEVVYAELRQVAARARFVGGHGETMQPTVLANEAYLMLARRLSIPLHNEPTNRQEFFRAAALAMRMILRDYWRARTARKRGGGQPRPGLGDHDPAAPQAEFEQHEFLALDASLKRLEQYNPRWYAVVLYRHFAGRSIEETADLVGVAVSTVKSDWQLARAWLRRDIEGSATADDR